jgi:hypothetical protein
VTAGPDPKPPKRRSPLLPGTRLQRLHASHSYGLVLVMVLATFVFVELAGDEPWTASVLLLFECVTLIVALWTSGLARAGSPLNFVLVLIAAALAVALAITTGNALEGAVGLVSGVLSLSIACVVGLGVFDQGEINGQSVLGAISIYLLLGFLFLFLYDAIVHLNSAPLFAQGTDGTRATRLYFSYITLATVGYGDYTPGPNVARVAAVFEALSGQLYLVTVIAVLVSRMRVRRRPDS